MSPVVEIVQRIQVAWVNVERTLRSNIPRRCKNAQNSASGTTTQNSIRASNIWSNKRVGILAESSFCASPTFAIHSYA
jgi:hypothetical protein